jgi:exopolysaccharide biosynthesis polyprenyl glycosylphosphotransferase
MFSDVLLVSLAFLAALLVRSIFLQWIEMRGQSIFNNPYATVGTLLAYVVVFSWVAQHYGLYRAEALSNPAHEFRLIVQTSLNTGLVLSGGLYLFKVHLPRGVMILVVLIAAAVLSMERVLKRVLQDRQATEAVITRQIAILGTNQLCYAISEHIAENVRLGYRFAGFVSFPGCRRVGNVPNQAVIGDISDIASLVRSHFVDEILIAEFCPSETAMDIINAAHDLQIDVRAIPGYYPELTQNARLERLGVFPVVPLHQCTSRTIGFFFKRIADVLLSALALSVLLIPMAFIALAIRLDSPGPVFYLSTRVGKRGRPFTCFKFRTMVQNAEELKKDLIARNERDGILFKITNDPRITPLGRFLRKYSLDELPQFANVLLGHMSLVGPRPPIVQEVKQYKPDQRHRLNVMPGLTGLWQIQARCDRSFSKYIALDIAYIENWNLWLDFKIMLRTIGVVLRGTGS